MDTGPGICRRKVGPYVSDQGTPDIENRQILAGNLKVKYHIQDSFSTVKLPLPRYNRK